MQTVTFAAGDATVTIRNRTRRTAIVEAKYRQVLNRAFPEVVEYEQALHLIIPPRMPDKNEGEAKLRYEEAQDKYLSKVVATRSLYPVGSAYASRFEQVVILLSRISDIQGAKFHVNGTGMVPDEEVVIACEDYLEGDFDVDENDFWLILTRQINKMDFPVTPVEARPPEFVSKDETKDPLSDDLEEIFSDKLKLES